VVLSIVDIYNEVLAGKRKRFPRGTWANTNNAIAVIQYLLEVKLKWSREQICNNLTHKTFEEHRLGGMLALCFKDSCYEAINLTYPDEYKAWELSGSPHGLWNLENGILATRWLIEEKLKWSHEDVCEYLTRKVFSDNNLYGMLTLCFGNSPYAALQATYPGMYEPRKLHSTPRGYGRSTIKNEVSQGA